MQIRQDKSPSGHLRFGTRIARARNSLKSCPPLKDRPMKHLDFLFCCWNLGDRSWQGSVLTNWTTSPLPKSTTYDKTSQIRGLQDLHTALSAWVFRIVAIVARNTEPRSLILKILSTPLGILLRSLVRSLSRRHYALIDNDSLGSRSHSSGLRRPVTLRCPQAAESTPLLSF